MGSLFGDSADPIAAPDYSQMDPLTNKLYEQVNNDQPWMAGRETPGQAQFKYDSAQAMNNVLQGQSAQRGVRASQLASMGNNTGANMQSQINGQAAIRDAAEREEAQNQLANIFLQQQGQKIAVNSQNQQNQQQQIAGQDRMLGMGLTAAGYAFGGPAGGMAASQIGGGGSSAPTNMGANPFEATPYVSPNPYNKYGFSQGLQF